MLQWGKNMVRLKVSEILKEQGKSDYWLMKRLNMCYRNYTNMVTGVTKSIRYDILDQLCNLLNVSISDLLEQCIEDSDE